jgi:hypothetical protein
MLRTLGKMQSSHPPVRIKAAPFPPATFQIQNGVQVHVLSLAKHSLLYSDETVIRTIYFHVIAFQGFTVQPACKSGIGKVSVLAI